MREAAKSVGGITDFDARLRRRRSQEVKTDASLGGLLGVNSTPTFFVNGRKLPAGVIPANYLDALIELELKRAK